jgi:mono/diheme cytochrome c family protein
MNRFVVLALTATLALAACGKVNKQAPENPTNPQPTGAPASSAPAPDAAPAPANDPPPAPSFADPKLQHGYDVFQKWCAPCHAPGPRHPGTQALAAKYKGAQPDALEQRKDLTPDLVKYFVRNGVSIMPPFRKTEITDQELDDLGAYLSRPR